MTSLKCLLNCTPEAGQRGEQCGGGRGGGRGRRHEGGAAAQDGHDAHREEENLIEEFNIDSVKLGFIN